MSATEQAAAITRNFEGISTSLFDAWAHLNILRGINEAVRAGLPDENLTCSREIYRAAFSALYTAIGAILDTSDGVHSLYRLLDRLRSYWTKDPALLELVESVEKSLASDKTAEKLKAWRNKVIAHRTSRASDETFYEGNKVNLNEVAEFMDLLASHLQDLSINVDGTVYYGHENGVPGLQSDIARLFTRGI